MSKLCLLLVILVVVVAAGCASDSGSKEFAPGQGWQNAG